MFESFQMPIRDRLLCVPYLPNSFDFPGLKFPSPLLVRFPMGITATLANQGVAQAENISLGITSALTTAYAVAILKLSVPVPYQEVHVP